MKKIVLLFLLLIGIVGCESKNQITTIYEKEVLSLQKQTTFQTEYPFTIEASAERISEEELMYHVIIDHPTTTMYQVKVLAIHDQETSDIYPSIGIVDDPIDLFPNQENSDVKGIALVGYLPYETETSLSLNFKIMVEWNDSSKNHHQVFIQLPFDKESE